MLMLASKLINLKTAVEAVFRIKKVVAGALLFALACSCSYRFNGCEQEGAKETITIPYIPGDAQGQLNASLVEAMSETGRYEYRGNDGHLLLKAVLVADNSERTDFRYDREPISGRRKKSLVAIGNRRTATAEVTLIDTRTDEVLFGPATVTASADFDYDNTDVFEDLVFFTPGGNPQTMIDFSLGQLDSVEGAHDVSASPLYHNLAQKIVDGIMNLE